MLGVNQLDFINYTTALKGNYRKGVHKLETILANPTHAAEFAANLGGVSVVLGVPIGKEDKNSEVLLSLLRASSVADAAAYTWLGQFYKFTSWDDLLGDAGRCQEMMADPFIWRAMDSSVVAVGKGVATLAGLDCSAYADMAAVAASQTAMTAVIANDTALNVVVSSSIAMAAIAASQTAMAAVAASYIAVAAVYESEAAVNAIKANETAWATLTGASSEVMGKAVAVIAGLNPNSYADMAAIAASQTAMAAVAASTPARLSIVSNADAFSAVSASEYFNLLLDKHTPKMTSNTTPSGVASGYKLNSNGGEPYLWFDKNLSTRVDPAYGSSGSLTLCYVQYMFPEPVIVFAFGLCGGAQNQNTGAVTAVKVQCSNDGSTWTTIESSLAVPGLPSSDLKKYCINNAQVVAAKYWRVHAVAGVNNTCVFFNEVDFYYV